MTRLNREALIARAMGQPRPVPMRRREWWRGAVLYQVYVRSFRDANGDGIGDLPGVIEKLDYLAGLNIDGIWLSPFYPSPQKDFGYDIVDMRNVDPLHGSMDDFLRLLSEAHGRGLKVLVDFVPIHTSEEHPWFQESRSSRDNPKADWYVWADAARDGGPPSNWLSSFGGAAWTWDPRRSQYYYHPFLTCQPALNLLNEEALNAMLEEVRFWLDLGADGLRLDAVQALACDPDLRSNPPASSAGSLVQVGGGPNNPFRRQTHLFDRDVPESLAIVERLRQAAAGYEPERVLIGELADVDSSRLAEKYTMQDRGFHAVYDFDLINTPADAHTLTQTLQVRSDYLRTGWLMNVFSNHDATRGVSNLTKFAIEHGFEVEAAKMLLFLQLTLQGGGVVYQGEELGLTHPRLAYEQLRDPWGLNLWPDFEGRDGARTPMPWSSRLKHGGFTEGGRPWIDLPAEHRAKAVDRQEADEDSCLCFFRRFMAWRRTQPVLIWGEEQVRDPDLAPLIVYDRFGDGTLLTCIVNFSLDARLFPLPQEDGAQVVAAPGCATQRSDQGIDLPRLGFAILARPEAAAPDR